MPAPSIRDFAPTPRARTRAWPDWAAPSLAAVLATLLVGVWGGLGVLSLPGLLLAGLSAGAGLAFVLARAPWLPALLTPALIPLPLVGLVFPFELVLGLTSALLLLQLWRSEPSRILRASRWEVANFVFVAWSFVTIFWCFDTLHVLLGVRRLLVGVLAGWTAYRLAHHVSRRVFEWSLLSGLFFISLAALRQTAGTGLSAQGLLLHRASAGDLGWGTANYVATLLLLLAPVALALLVAPRPLVMRALALAGLLAAGALQVLVASRAAAVLFFVGVLVQVFLMLRSRARWTGVGLILLAMTGALMSPFGQNLISRFTNLRDLGSMVIRLWYFREGWHRVVDFFPFGMGLNQGLAYADKMSGIDLHDYWLVVTSEVGVPGLLAWLAALAFQLRAFARVRRTPGFERLGLGLQVGFWLGQLHTLVEPTFQGVQYQFLWFWIGLGMVGYARAESASASSER